jgi:hypothetical protein
MAPTTDPLAGGPKHKKKRPDTTLWFPAAVLTGLRLGDSPRLNGSKPGEVVQRPPAPQQSGQSGQQGQGQLAQSHAALPLAFTLAFFAEVAADEQHWAQAGQVSQQSGLQQEAWAFAAGALVAGAFVEVVLDAKLIKATNARIRNANISILL